MLGPDGVHLVRLGVHLEPVRVGVVVLAASVHLVVVGRYV